MAALQRRWFMALSTSEFMTDTSSESYGVGQSGVTPVSASVLKAGSGTWLVEVWPVGSPDIVRRTLFLIRHR